MSTLAPIPRSELADTKSVAENAVEIKVNAEIVTPTQSFSEFSQEVERCFLNGNISPALLNSNPILLNKLLQNLYVTGGYPDYTVITMKKLMWLLDKGASISYVDRHGRGLLTHFIPIWCQKEPIEIWQYSGHVKMLYDPLLDPLSVLKLFLQKGTNPLHLTWNRKVTKISDYRERISYEQRSLLSLAVEGPREIRKYSEWDPTNWDPTKVFTTLCEFGAGLIRKEKRFLTSAENSFTVKWLQDMSQHFLSEKIVGSENFVNGVQNGEIFLIGENDKHQKVFIYSIEHLKNILNGTTKNIIIPAINTIAQYVFEAVDDALPPVLKSIFEQYLAEHYRGVRLESRYPQYFLDCKASLEKSEANEYCYSIIPDYEGTEGRKFNDDVGIFPEWLRDTKNLTEILCILAKRQIEVAFVALLSRIREFQGQEEFIKFISLQSHRFFQNCGGLLLFFSIKMTDWELFSLLMKDEIQRLIKVKDNSPSFDIILGREKRSLLQIFLESDYQYLTNLDSLTHQEKEMRDSLRAKMWPILIRCTDIHHRDTLEETALTEMAYGSNAHIIKSLLELGASPFILDRHHYHTILERIMSSAHSKPNPDHVNNFLTLCDHGAGMISRDFRFEVGRNISSSFDFIHHCVDTYPNLFPHDFLLKFINADIVARVHKDHFGWYGANTQHRWIFSIDELQEIFKVPPSSLEGWYFTNFEALCGNILNTEDTVVPIKVKRLFFDKVLENLDYHEMIRDTLKGSHNFSDNIASIIHDYSIMPNTNSISFRGFLKILNPAGLNNRKFNPFRARLEQFLNGVQDDQRKELFLPSDLKRLQSYKPYLDSPWESFPKPIQYPSLFEAHHGLCMSYYYNPKDKPYNITRVNFVLEQYKAWMFNKKEKEAGRRDSWFGEEDSVSHFNRVLNLDDNIPENLQKMQELLNNGLHVVAMAHCYEGEALVRLILKNKIHYLKLLIDAGFNIDQSFRIRSTTKPDEYYEPPIVEALLEGNMRAVALLLDAGVTLEIDPQRRRAGQNWYSLTLAECAAQGKCLKEFIELLQGMKIPLLPMIETETDTLKIFKNLLNKDDTDPINRLVFPELITRLLNLKLTLDQLDDLMCDVIKAKKPKYLELLSAAGINISSRIPLKDPTTAKGRSFLGMALEAGDLESALLIIKGGSLLYEKGNFAKPMLHYAEKGKCKDEFQKLLKDIGKELPPLDRIFDLKTSWEQLLKNDRHEQDSYFRAAFLQLIEAGLLTSNEVPHLDIVFGVVEHRNASCLAILIKTGVNINCKNAYNRLPLGIALQYGDIVSAKMLVEAGSALVDGDIEYNYSGSYYPRRQEVSVSVLSRAKQGNCEAAYLEMIKDHPSTKASLVISDKTTANANVQANDKSNKTSLSNPSDITSASQTQNIVKTNASEESVNSMGQKTEKSSDKSIKKRVTSSSMSSSATSSASIAHVIANASIETKADAKKDTNSRLSRPNSAPAARLTHATTKTKPKEPLTEFTPHATHRNSVMIKSARQTPRMQHAYQNYLKRMSLKSAEKSADKCSSAKPPRSAGVVNNLSQRMNANPNPNPNSNKSGKQTTKAKVK